MIRFAQTLLFSALLLTAAGVSAADASATARAVFAGGCFWCMEKPFDEVPGVLATTSGYTGGTKVNPTYKEVSSGTTGHLESIEISYDPKRVTYEQLLDVFWHNIDPLSADGQFCDRGNQYRSAIFPIDDAQRAAAAASLARIEKQLGRKVATLILPASTFYPAEDYHQNYYQKNPVRYQYYRWSCGRDQRLEEVWGKGAGHTAAHTASDASSSAATTASPAPGGWNPMSFDKPDDKTLRARLTPLQYDVTQKEGTERPFQNEYWDNHAPGIYVDVVSGEPLFSSLDKYDSGTGWPSFSRPLEASNISERVDRKFFTTRTEIRSKHADSHLGHVFDDGPAPTGQRYCMNSAALRFIPLERLEAEGYGQYLSLFRASASAK